MDNTRRIQDAIMRELQRAAKEVTRDQLHALYELSFGATSIAIAKFTRVLHGLVSAGRVAQKLDETHLVLRYSLPAERYRLRNAINAWHVDRQDRDTPGVWHTIVQATEREARLCAGVLNANDTKVANGVVAATRAQAHSAARRKAT